MQDTMAVLSIWRLLLEEQAILDAEEDKEMICKVCKKWFRPKKENLYITTEVQSFAEAMLRPPTTYDAVDCPRCGRQHVVGVRMPTKEG